MTVRRTILLVNLGTPDRPDADAIRSYLQEFLSDPRVVDLPRWLWLPILNLFILRTRPAKLVEKYKLIWGTNDGPIRNITSALAGRVQHLMPDVPVYAAMTYGKPSVSDVLKEIGDVDQITVLPLFAQYASATTGAVEDVFAKALQGSNVHVQLVDNYHDDPGYIKALADSIRHNHAYRSGEPFVVFSYHGIPQLQAREDHRYPDQCLKTSELVSAELGLPADRWRMTFQSRFGPAPWLQPYTDKTMGELPAEGHRNVLLVCPGFAVDCLETIQEIRVLNREIFMASGGESFAYVKALNASWSHARLIASLLQNR